MRTTRTLFAFAVRQWVLAASAAALVGSSLYARRLPVYSSGEFRVLFLLFVLFVTIRGLQEAGLMSRVTGRLQSRRLLPLRLVLGTFFLSMFVTNDIALMIVVPISLALPMEHTDILVILEALAANAGSALTPIGNPQNLFIAWYYGVSIVKFTETIAPFSVVFLVLLAAASCLVSVHHGGSQDGPARTMDKKGYVYGLFLVLILSIVLHVVPILSGFFVIAFALFLDRRALRIDYALMVTFVLVFGAGDNLRYILDSEIRRTGHVFLLSALTSQVIGNVPATILFAKVTPHWQALLWGSNAGGFGSLFGSFANLIAYRLYVTQHDSEGSRSFVLRFLLIGYLAFSISILVYLLIY